MNGPPEMQTAASWQGGDGRGNGKVQTAFPYRSSPETATDFPLAFVAMRFRLSRHMAALVAELAGIGARHT